MTNADMGNPAPSRDYHNYILLAAGLLFALFVLWDRTGPEDASQAAPLSSYVGTASLRVEAPAPSQAASAPVSTPEFIRKVALSDMFEIQSSRLARGKTDPGALDYADQMILAHQKTSAELKGLIEGGKVRGEIPQALDDAHKQKLARLASLDGQAFRDAYITMQREAHQDAVSLFSAYARNGDNADLKNWATTTLGELNHHLEMARSLK